VLHPNEIVNNVQQWMYQSNLYNQNVGNHKRQNPKSIAKHINETIRTGNNTTELHPDLEYQDINYSYIGFLEV
jgi:hypothetical protein